MSGADADADAGAPRPACLACLNAAAGLTGAIAHEVNQPLMSISANAGAALHHLQRHPADLERIGAMLAEIVVQSQRAGAVIQAMQTLAQQHAQADPIGLHALAQALPLHARAALERHGTRLELDLAAQRDDVEIDPAHLRELLLGLVEHALRALAPLSGELRAPALRLATRTLQGRRIEVRVDFPDRDGAGTHGMRLTVCRAIAESHGGSLRIEAAGADRRSIVVILPQAP